MILGRPTNLWVGAASAVLAALVLVGVLKLTVEQLAGINVAVAAVVVLIANSTPTVKSGSEVNVVTPEGEPNFTTTV